jgi:hypothetical protein
MKDADIQAAMLSIDAVVPVWQAANLENSGYTALMRAENLPIMRSLVETAYGYNALSKLLGDTPTHTRLYSGQMIVDVPYGLQSQAVAYEYDSNGLLLGYYQHVAGDTYSTANNSAALVEFVSGTMDTWLDETYGGQDIPVDPALDYRFYVCMNVDGVPDNNWTDVTGSDKYKIDNDIAHWNVDTAVYYTLVRSNKVVLAYSVNVANLDGILEVTLTQRAYRNNVLVTQPLQVPLGELDIFLNKHSLIEDLDYVVDLPKVYIRNKSFLNTAGTQTIDIRFTGFCDSDMSRDVSTDTGFISHGLLSNNTRFDLRDDKVQRIVVNGALKHKDQLKFAESDSGVSVPDATNGQPYLVRDIVVPMRGYTDGDTYTLRAAATVVDKQVSDFMSLKVAPPTFDGPNVIPAQYQVISPFCAKILSDLNSKALNDPRLTGRYSDADVYTICKPYEYLLKYDPTQDGQQPDPNYVLVVPHHHNTVVNVSVYTYNFMLRVVRLYLKNRLDLANFLMIV